MDGQIDQSFSLLLCVAECLVRATMGMGNIKYHKIAAVYHFTVTNLKGSFVMCLSGRLAHLNIIVVCFKIGEEGLEFHCGIGKDPNERAGITVSLSVPTLNRCSDHEIKVSVAAHQKIDMWVVCE